MSDRFYFDGPLGPGDVLLEGAEAHHLSAVRRFEPGDRLTLFNGDGHEFPGTLVEVGKKRATVRVTSVLSPSRELGFTLHVASALPKGDRGDFLIEKLTELGATDFTPLITERSVVQAGQRKADRLRRAVIEASKQCGRNTLMRVHDPARWMEWSPRQAGRRYLAHPEGQIRHVHESGDVIVAIGPEGGFSDSEVQVAVDGGWIRLSLGPRVLRVETAGVAAAVLFGLGSGQ